MGWEEGVPEEMMAEPGAVRYNDVPKVDVRVWWLLGAAPATISEYRGCWEGGQPMVGGDALVTGGRWARLEGKLTEEGDGREEEGHHKRERCEEELERGTR
jgi:hypothetical protein